MINFAEAYKRYGLIKTEKSIVYKEWAPGAKKMYLTGDFCGWEKKKHEMKKDDFGNWTIELPDL